MKPKTKLQQEVWNLHNKLSEPIEHEPYVIAQHDFYYTTHYKNLVCMECNHQWKPIQKWHEEILGVKCPNCNKKLNKINTQNGGIAVRIVRYSVAEVVGRFQVIRYFSGWKHMSKNKPPKYSFNSLFEEWKDWDKNKRVIIGRTIGWTGDGFNSTPYEIRNPNGSLWSRSGYDTFLCDFNCPNGQFLPRFKKYGLNKYKHNCDIRILIERLEMSPKIETILKSGQYKLLYYAINKSSHEHNRYWSQVKIAIRHKYKVKDPGIWYDYIDLLSYFGKDIHNPKFLFPYNLKKEHDLLMEKRRIKIEFEENEKRKQSNLEVNNRLEKFKDLKFVNDNIVVEALKNVQEFKEDGDELKHCVYTNEYYLKENSLILSAKVSGVRTETIEVDLKTFNVVQSRGLKNEPTQYHKQIVELVKNNMNEIRKTVKSNEKGKIKNKLASKLVA